MHDKPPLIEGKPSGFRRLLGYRVDVWRENHAEIVLDADERHLNGLGILHGGVYATLLDASLGHAATFCPDPARTRICVTISLTTSFLAPTPPGVVRAVGRCLAIHDRIATAQGEMLDAAGQRVATAQASFRYMPGSEQLEGVPRRPSP
jgi:uncharacterized protein (TIGR00369 family)